MISSASHYSLYRHNPLREWETFRFEKQRAFKATWYKKPLPTNNITQFSLFIRAYPWNYAHPAGL
jgi:hypothetical protein